MEKAIRLSLIEQFWFHFIPKAFYLSPLSIQHQSNIVGLIWMFSKGKLQQALVCDARRDGWRRVAAERQLDVIERLLALMPRSRGFRVSTDGNVSVYPASPRARLPAEKREGYPKPPIRAWRVRPPPPALRFRDALI